MISIIPHFEADFLWKVSLKILNSGIILKTFTHEDRTHSNTWAAMWDFQQCGIPTRVVSDKFVQPPVALNDSNFCSIGSLRVIDWSATSKSSDQTAHMCRLIWAFAGRSFHIDVNLTFPAHLFVFQVKIAARISRNALVPHAYTVASAQSQLSAGTSVSVHPVLRETTVNMYLWQPLMAVHWSIWTQSQPIREEEKDQRDGLKWSKRMNIKCLAPCLKYRGLDEQL